MKLPEFFGLDIGNHSIKVCQVKWKGNNPRLVAFGKSTTPVGIIGSENEDHHKELAKHIREAMKDANIKTDRVVVGLPESKIFTQLITIPKVEDDKVEELIHWEAKKYVPIPIDEVRVDWIFLGERNVSGKKHLDLFLIAAPNNLVNRFVKVLKLGNFEPLGIETESVATTRSLWWKQQLGLTEEGNIDNTPVMVMDFGANSTDLAVAIGGTLLFSQSLVTGSDALTEAIASDFGLEMQQAEEYKRSYGLDSNQLEGKIAKSLTPIMNVIVSEAVKTLDFFKSRFQKSVPRRLLLVGDGAKLPGIMNFMATELGIETSLADPLDRVDISKKIASKVEQKSSVGYSVSLGLALKAG